MSTVQLANSIEKVTPAEGLADFLAEVQAEADERIELFQQGYALCESPIEQQLFVQWLQCFGQRLEQTLSDDLAHTHTCYGLSIFWNRQDIWLTLYPQHPTILNGHNYRVDFLVEAHSLNPCKGTKPLCSIVVELDGHDFHERTKEQATRDKRRDREFVQGGFTVLRFTGSEIYASPVAAVLDIQNTVRRLLAK